MPPKPQPNNKKAKLFNSRAIRAEVVDPSIKEGILNVPQFLSSREYEIKAFEQSQLKTKQASSSRVFQSLPRTLRRRAASHNVKRIPKRLRSAAIKEMQNSTNGKPPRKKEPRGRARHRLRVRKRLLALAAKIRKAQNLPRSNESASIPERLKELNIQLKDVRKQTQKPLNNIVGAYDHTGEGALATKPKGNVKYAKRQIQHTWLPTHLWHAKRFHMLKRWGFQIPFSPNQKCFRATSRAAKQSALLYDTSYFCELTVQCPSESATSTFLLHITKYNDPVPSWLLQGHSSYDGWLYKDATKYSPGMVLATSGTTIYVRLHPASYEQFFEYCVAIGKDFGCTVHDCRYSLGSIRLQGPASLQCLSKVLHIQDSSDSVVQPWRRFAQCNDSNLVPPGVTFAFFVEDPRYWKKPVNSPPAKGNLDVYQLIEQKTSFVETPALHALLLSEGRTASYKDMLSVSQIGKEFGKNDPFSQKVHGKSKFPLLITKAENHWVAVAPWHWVQPLWTKLTQVADIKTAGIRQFHQVNFEQGRQTYPHDYPFIPEGFKENHLVQSAYELARSRLPASKRRPMTTERGLKLSGGDWYFLRKWTFGLQCLEKDATKSHAFGEFTEDCKRRLITEEDLEIVISHSRKTLEEKEYNDGRLPITLYKKKDPLHNDIVSGNFQVNRAGFPQLPVVPCHLEIINKGTIADYARIYEINQNGKPELKNLIGFITTGAINVKAGCPTGLGLVNACFKDCKKVMVRNVGCTGFHVARVKIL